MESVSSILLYGATRTTISAESDSFLGVQHVEDSLIMSTQGEVQAKTVFLVTEFEQ
jgi:hypothetical protein